LLFQRREGSEAVVRAMAEGALERTKANVAIAVSGIAGPSGAVPGKPVGTVWFALAHRVEERLECEGHLIQFDGNRDAVRRQAVEYALNLLRALPQPV
jgi:nicotinamide-nucleotide amidase